MDYGKTFINYGILTIVLQGDAEILHKRYLNRIYNENRHPVHLILYQTDRYLEYMQRNKLQFIGEIDDKKI